MNIFNRFWKSLDFSAILEKYTRDPSLKIQRGDIFVKIANFWKYSQSPPCEYFQPILEVSFDFSAIFRKKYKGLLFENIFVEIANLWICQKISKGSTLIKFPKIVLAYFRWNCKIFGKCLYFGKDLFFTLEGRDNFLTHQETQWSLI